jgi:hypothetical protein
MSPVRLASLAAYAGDRLHADGPSGPYPFGPDVPVAARKAVYLVSGWSGRILYVGSTTAGVQARLSQHFANFRKSLDWSTVYVVPLVEDTPVTSVRRIEGRIGLVVKPERNKALPSVGWVPGPKPPGGNE